MNTINNEILSAIDKINEVTMEAELSVINALCNEYEKSILILENYEGEDLSCFDIFQESVIMEDGSSKKQNIFKRMWNTIKALFHRFITFLKRKCGYVGLVIRMKKNPDEEVFCPLPLKKTYDSYNEFYKYIGKLSEFVNSFDPMDLDDAGKVNKFFYKKMYEMDISVQRPPKAETGELKDLMEEYERFDKGEQVIFDQRLIDAGDKKETVKAKMMNSNGFYSETEKLVSLKSIVENIEKLNKIRVDILKKAEELVKFFEKYDGVSPDNECIRDVLKYFSWYKGDIVDFIKCDTALERCLTTQFANFLKYSKKHKTENANNKSANNISRGSEFAQKHLLRDVFYDAVEFGNVRRVRIMMKNSMLVDPTFQQFHAMEKVAASMSGLYDEYDGKELIEDKSLWDDHYMDKMMVKVINNFSHERLDHLKRIVQHLRPVNK